MKKFFNYIKFSSALEALFQYFLLILTVLLFVPILDFLVPLFGFLSILMLPFIAVALYYLVSFIFLLSDRIFKNNR